MEFTNTKENGFETLIVKWLVEENGYEEGTNADYSKEFAVDVTRQLRYSDDNRKLALDLCIFINGLPVITMELKNQLTKQNAAAAVEQYKNDRSPRSSRSPRRTRPPSRRHRKNMARTATASRRTSSQCGRARRSA